MLAREKFVRQLLRRGLAVGDLLHGYAALAYLVSPAVIAPTVLRDPADDHVLAAALGAQADAIVSGDAHLLDLKTFRGMAIINAAEATARVYRLA